VGLSWMSFCSDILFTLEKLKFVYDYKMKVALGRELIQVESRHGPTYGSVLCWRYPYSVCFYWLDLPKGSNRRASTVIKSYFKTASTEHRILISIHPKSGHYPSFSFLLKTRGFGDWRLSPTSVGPTDKVSLYLRTPATPPDTD
jgi:hypothetical protein